MWCNLALHKDRRYLAAWWGDDAVERVRRQDGKPRVGASELAAKKKH